MDQKPQAGTELNQERKMISLSVSPSPHLNTGDIMHAGSGCGVHPSARDESFAAPSNAQSCHAALPPPAALNGMKLLPPDFVPSNYSIICGRGKGNYNACGNRRFRVIVGTFLDQYIKANGCPVERGFIFNKVMEIVKEACPVGAFIRQIDGRYYELSERAAREKCSTTFRDCLMANKRATERQMTFATNKTDTKGETKKQNARPTPSLVASSSASSMIQALADGSERRGSAEGENSITSSGGSFFDVDTKEPMSIEDMNIETLEVDDAVSDNLQQSL